MSFNLIETKTTANDNTSTPATFTFDNTPTAGELLVLYIRMLNSSDPASLVLPSGFIIDAFVDAGGFDGAFIISKESEGTESSIVVDAPGRRVGGIAQRWSKSGAIVKSTPSTVNGLDAEFKITAGPVTTSPDSLVCAAIGRRNNDTLTLSDGFTSSNIAAQAVGTSRVWDAAKISAGGSESLTATFTSSTNVGVSLIAYTETGATFTLTDETIDITIAPPAGYTAEPIGAGWEGDSQITAVEGDQLWITAGLTVGDTITGDDGTYNVIHARASDGLLSYYSYAIDTVAPTLTLPTGTETGQTTATVTVTTDEDNGNLFVLITQAASALAEDVVSLGNTQEVTETGVQSADITLLTAESTYYAHFVQVDAFGNESDVSSSAAFTTEAVPLVPQGTITIGAITVTETTASIPFTYNDTDQTGFQFRLIVPSVGNWLNASSPIALSNLAPDSPYEIEIRAINAAGEGTATSQTFTSEAEAVDPGDPNADDRTQSVTISYGSGYPNTAILESGFDTTVSVQLASAPVVGDMYATESGVTPYADGTIDVGGKAVYKLLHIRASDGTIYTHEVDTTGLEDVDEATVAPESQVAFGTPSSTENSITVSTTYPGSDATGFERRVDGGSWVAYSSPITLTGLTDDTSYLIEARATNSIGAGPISSITATTDVESAVDTTPDAFYFTAATNQPLSTLIESNAITITGVDPDTDITVSVAGAQYAVSIDGGASFFAFTDSTLFARLNNQIKLRLTTSADYETAASGTLTIGGVNGTFTATTQAEAVVDPDTTPPVITILGDNPLTITEGDAFTDPGATAVDDEDGDLTASITVAGTVDTSTPDTYTITYSATDTAGNTGTATRTVVVEAIVVEPPAPGIGPGRANSIAPGQTFSVDASIPALEPNQALLCFIETAGVKYWVPINTMDATTVTVTAPANLPPFAVGSGRLRLSVRQFND